MLASFVIGLNTSIAQTETVSDIKTNEVKEMELNTQNNINQYKNI